VVILLSPDSSCEVKLSTQLRPHCSTPRLQMHEKGS
jgi:hypothetical protein